MLNYLHSTLGSLRASTLQREAELMVNVKDTNQQIEKLVRELALAERIDLSKGNWRFDFESQTFKEQK